MTEDAPEFRGGNNIALKIPKFRFAETVSFYRDTLKLPYLGEYRGSPQFRFGPVVLWLDLVENYSQADVWLELYTDDPEHAAKYLTDRGTPLRDEIESLDGVGGHWVSDPAGTIHLLSRTNE